MYFMDAETLASWSIDWSLVTDIDGLLSDVANHLNNALFQQHETSDESYLMSYRQGDWAFVPKTATTPPEMSTKGWVMYQSRYLPELFEKGFCASETSPKIFRIHTEGHLFVAVWFPKDLTVEIFDSLGMETPEQFERIKKYTSFFQERFKEEKIQQIINVNSKNIQACNTLSKTEDKFCQTWSLWYLYERLALGKSPKQITDALYRLSPNQRFDLILSFFHFLSNPLLPTITPSMSKIF
jgi:hypothetical protein